MCKTTIILSPENECKSSSQYDLAAERRLLRKIYKDIATRRLRCGEKEVDMLGFLKCTGLPGLLGEQFFKALDADRDDHLSLSEFVDGFITLYRGSYQEVTNLLFNVLDFGHKGFVTLHGLKIISRYLPDFCPKCGAKILHRNDYLPEIDSLFSTTPILSLEEALPTIAHFPRFFEDLLQTLITSLPPVFDHVLLRPCESPTCAEISSAGLCPLKFNGRRYFAELRDQAMYLYLSVEKQFVKKVLVMKGLFVEPVGVVEFALKAMDFQYVFEATSEHHRDQWLERLLDLTHFRWFDDYYETGELIGSGAFGQVLKAVHRVTRTQAAVKIINKRPMEDLHEIRLRREIDVLRLGKHENLVELYDVFETNDRVYIVTEFVAGGSLFEFLETRKFKTEENFAKGVARDLANGLSFLHKLGIIHRDIKLENILLTSSTPPRAKLIDFGLATFLGPDDRASDAVGTLKYVSPEIISRIKYRELVDSWGLGIVLYIMLAGKLPFFGKCDEDVALSILKKELKFDSDVWYRVSTEAKTVINRLLSRRPDTRMTLKELLESAWISQAVSMN